MYCPSCGQEYHESQNSCPNCRATNPQKSEAAEKTAQVIPRSSGLHTWTDIGLFKGKLKGFEVKLAIIFGAYMALYLFLMMGYHNIWTSKFGADLKYFLGGLPIAAVPVALGVGGVVVASRKGFNQSIAFAVGFGVPWLCIAVLFLSVSSPGSLVDCIFYSVPWLNAVIAFGFGLFMGMIFENRAHNFMSGFILGFAATWILQCACGFIEEMSFHNYRLLLFGNVWFVGLHVLWLSFLAWALSYVVWTEVKKRRVG